MTIDVAPHLFSPIKVGDLELKHRIVMGPLTRSRSPKEVANTLNAEYYGQRATDGGLLISEGTSPSLTAAGYPNVPGILTEEQSKGWKLSTAAVHAKGGYIYAQLWHTGRAGKSEFQPDKKAPVSASAIPIDGKETPRALDLDEIKYVVNEFQTSAKWAREAGFDGIEIHAAHGYLIDQFLQTSSNKRDDHYGGSIENRARFLFEVVDAVLKELPASKVAIRLSPWLGIQNVSDEDPETLFKYVLVKLNAYKLAYIHLTEPVWGGWQQGPPHSQSKLQILRPLITSPTKLLLTGGYTLETGEEAVAAGRADIIGYGRPFITNPDLVERFRLGKPLTDYSDPSKYYGGGREGYADYLTWEEEEQRKEKKEKLIPGSGATHSKY